MLSTGNVVGKEFKRSKENQMSQAKVQIDECGAI